MEAQPKLIEVERDALVQAQNSSSLQSLTHFQETI